VTHYDEFGLSPTASVEEIQRAHRNLARLLQPDPIQDEELRRLAESQLKRINHMY
jgi:curved DNA-binding protein CbpA